ncbi:MAG: yjbG [Chlamydiales bacterium]|jgi:oligoendopeptidase F|nr:yjbG [Chlamydiales bacterium]
MRARNELDKSEKWNVEAFIPSWEDWEKQMQAITALEEKRFEALHLYKGTLKEGPLSLKKALDCYFELDQVISALYTYSHLRHDEDLADEKSKQAYSRALALYTDFQKESAWLHPEILALPHKMLKSFLQDLHLAPYAFYLEKLVRLRNHTLSADKEHLLAASSLALQTASQTFSALNNADFKFSPVLDSANNERELTHGSYGIFIRDQDRALRKDAFEKMHKKYADYENSLAELLNGQVQTHSFLRQARHYSSSLEAALFPKNIDTAVYYSLIESVQSRLPSLHKYIALRKKVLGLSEMHLYDLYVPITKDMDIHIDYSEAVELILESVEPLGPDYQQLLEKGLKTDRWVDRYENQNKRSGAYSSGCYTSMPYILMNYKKLLRDAFTLAHEAGHSMHSLLSNQNQPYHNASYPIFVAEVASTFNEDLLMRTLLRKASSTQEKIFLINQKIEDIRSTLFRQTMFAEFELKIHTLADHSKPLTPEVFKQEFLSLNKAYFGPNVIIDPLIANEWARIPHFYYNFYVYQYATGISAALALSQKVVQGGESERNAYLSFLKGGCSRYPIDLLCQAGVDMRKKEPVDQAIQIFDQLVDELADLLKQQENEAKHAHAIQVFS